MSFTQYDLFFPLEFDKGCSKFCGSLQKNSPIIRLPTFSILISACLKSLIGYIWILHNYVCAIF